MDELDDCYAAAPIVDFTVDGNCVHATITPNNKTGQLAHIVLNQPLDQPLHHTVNTVNSDASICPFIFHRTHEEHYASTGCIPKQHAPAILDSYPYSPSNNIRTHIKEALQQAGIKNKQKPSFCDESTPSNMQPITTIISHPLSTMIQTMLKESDNLIAENLFKKLGIYSTTPIPFSGLRGKMRCMRSLRSKASPCKKNTYAMARVYLDITLYRLTWLCNYYALYTKVIPQCLHYWKPYPLPVRTVRSPGSMRLSYSISALKQVA